MSDSAASWVACATCGTSWPSHMPKCPADGTPLGNGRIVEIDDDQLPPGTMIGEYKVESLLGAGGMGEVYGATHPVIGKRVAIKVMNRACSSNPVNVERFVHEAKAVNAIGHSNIVDIFSFGHTADGRCYFVMEWLQGESLRTRLDHGAVDAARAYDILDAVLRALEAAHAADIVHRDLKPDNIFLVRAKDGEPERVKLLDFGIAKLATDREGKRPSMTRTGTVVGTPSHMAPEQATGGAVGKPADVYSLGVVAFELATGTLPFVAESGVQMMAKHVDESPRAPSSIRPVSPGFESLILDMLRKAGAERPSVTEVRERIAKLRAIVATPFDPTGDSTVIPPRPATDPSIVRTVASKPTSKSEPSVAIRPGTEPTSPAIPIEVAAPSVQSPMIRFETPASAPQLEVLPPRASTAPIATGVSMPERSKTPWLVVAGVAAVAVVVAIVVLGGGSSHEAAVTTTPVQPAPVATPEPAPQPAPTPPAVTPTPAVAPEPTAIEAKRPKKITPHHTPVTPPVPTATPTPAPVPAPTPMPTAPEHHDVDGVRDPFADSPGAKK